MRSVVPFLLLIAATSPSIALAESDAAAAAQLRLEITKLVGEAHCNNLVNCRVLGLGAKPCGGPEEYIAFSVWSTSGDDVRSKAMEYNFLREEIADRADKAAACEVLPEPRAACVNGRCVTVPRD